MHVPYRGGNPAMQDLMAGRVDYLCDIITTAMPQIEPAREGDRDPVQRARRCCRTADRA